MADPTTAGGGTEGLREALINELRAEAHRQAKAHRYITNARYGPTYESLKAESTARWRAADALARASAEQARAEAERADERTRRLMAERAAERWMRDCRAAEDQAAGLGDKLNALAGRYGEPTNPAPTPWTGQEEATPLGYGCEDHDMPFVIRDAAGAEVLTIWEDYGPSGDANHITIGARIVDAVNGMAGLVLLDGAKIAPEAPDAP